MNNKEIIYSENVENELWQMLLQYSFASNIKNYFANDKDSAANDILVESIAGSIAQAYEYFSASKTSTINISPLLTYYGVSNLLYGVCCLKSKKQIEIASHGMLLDLESVSVNSIANTSLTAQYARKGALTNYDEILDGATFHQTTNWTLREILGSIPELRDDFINCYPGVIPYTVPVQIIKRNNDSVEVVSDKLFQDVEIVGKYLSDIDGFKKAYLTPQWPQNNNYMVLRKKIGGKEIGIYSISGRKHLQIGHNKNGMLITPSVIILIFMGLYILGNLSRYHPHIWSPFVRNDTTGERLLIEKFILVSRRLIPNLLLNELFGKRFVLLNEPQGITSELEEPDKEQIQSMITEEVKKQLKRK